MKHYFKRLSNIGPIVRIAAVFALIANLLIAARLGHGRGDVQALINAVASNDPDAVRDALERGVPPDANDGVAMMLAVSIPSPQTVRLLLAHGANPSRVSGSDYTPLQWATYGGDPETITLLLDAGASPNQMTNLGRTPLGVAALRGSDRAVDILLARGASARGIYAKGATHFEPPLVCAARSSLASADLVQKLIDAGADLNQPDDEGIAPLQAALAAERTDIVMLLIRRGALLHLAH